MRKWIGSVLIVLLQFGVSAQQDHHSKGKVNGQILDSASGTAVEFATLTLYPQGDKKAVTGALTDKTGKFIIEDVEAGSYRLLIECIGYHSHTTGPFAIKEDGSSLDLKGILLSKSQTTLQAVTVISQRGLIENKIDRVVFNAEKDITSQSGVATDILKKVPQISVDADGNVELSGSTSIRFLINGKPSSAFGSNVAEVLQSIPASQIKSIEVITNPGAKYDAEGLGGIINIILKQNTARGINGNVSLTAGTRTENGSLNLNARNGNLGLNAFISGNYRLKAATPSSSDRHSTDSISGTDVDFQQAGESRFIRHGFESGLGFDWTYHKKNQFTGSLNYDDFGNRGSGTLNQLQVTSDHSTGAVLNSLSSVSNSSNHFNFYEVNASLNYKRKFDREDQSFEVGYTTSFGTNHTEVGNNQLIMPQDSLFYGVNSVNPGKEHETEITIDYSQPLAKKTVFGIGAKSSFRDITSRSDVMSLQPEGNMYLPDSSLSNYLDYHQKVFAFYSEITFPVFDLFDARIGGRYERTDINSFYSNAAHQVNEPGYNTFVPSIFLSRKLGDDQTVKMSYSKRIERPDYRDLNPFINTSDPKNISAGNPYLQPEIGNRFELSYTRDFSQGGSFMINAFYRTSDHDIQPYIVYYPSLTIGDSVYVNVAVSTRQNIGLEKNAGVNLFLNLPVGSKFTVRTNLFFFQRHTINRLDPGYNANSFNYRTNINASYQFSKVLAGEFFGNFNSARNEVQGKYPSFTSYSIALRKQFWNKKGSLALIATNPFNKYVNQRTILYGPDFSVNAIRRIPFRSVGINFTWKFGKLEFKKDKEEIKDAPSPAEN